VAEHNQIQISPQNHRCAPGVVTTQRPKKKPRGGTASNRLLD
jgi:hypothetical protein